MSLYSLLPLSAAIFVFGYGIFVLRQNARSETNITFAAGVFVLSMWQFGIFMLLNSASESTALFWDEFIIAGLVFAPVFLYHFSVAFLKLRKERRFVPLLYVGSVLIVLFSNTPYFQKGVRQTEFGFYDKAGPFQFVITVFLFLVSVAALYNFRKAFKKSETHSIQRIRINHIFWGTVIVLMGAVDFLPSYGVNVPPLGSIFLFAFILITARAIVKYRFMEIDTLIHKSLGYLLLSLAVIVSYAVVCTAITMVFKVDFSKPIANIALIMGFLIVFNAFRDKVWGAMDLLFHRKKYVYREIIDGFVEKSRTIIDIGELLPMIVDTINEAMRIDKISIMLIDEGGIEYSVRAHRGLDNSNVRLNCDDPFATWLFSQRKLVEREQIGTDPWYSRMKEVGLQRFKELEAEICVPLTLGNQMIGILNLGKKVSGEAYKKEDIDLISNLTSQSSIAINNALTYNSLKARTDQLHMFADLGQAMGQSLELSNVLKVLADKIKNIMRAEIVAVLLRNEETGEFTIKESRGLDENAVKSTRLRTGDKISGWVAQHSQTILVHDIESDPRFKRRGQEKYYVNSLLSSPMVVKGRVIGVINVNNKDTKEVFTPHDLEILEGICAETSAIIENARLYTNLRQSYLRTIESLAEALEARDGYTYGHSSRVTNYSVKIARALSLPDDEVSNIAMAALLHDLGKIGIEDSILLKPSRLTKEEYNKVKDHPVTSEKIVKPIGLPKGVLAVIRHHHEWYNGEGYPDNLKEQNIPMGARIIAVSDAYDAMTSNRPYRKAMTKKQALQELKKYNYEQFDPEVIGIFLKIVEGEGDTGTVTREDAVKDPNEVGNK